MKHLESQKDACLTWLGGEKNTGCQCDNREVIKEQIDLVNEEIGILQCHHLKLIQLLKLKTN